MVFEHLNKSLSYDAGGAQNSNRYFAAHNRRIAIQRHHSIETGDAPDFTTDD
jgi:hypothetical protein